MKKHPVVHFEMPYVDKQRMADFYTQAFGWELDMLGPEFGNYVLAMTTDSDQNGPKEKGAINGGFYKKTDDSSSHCPSFVIAVDDTDAAVDAVLKAGGTLSGGREDMPTIGLFQRIIDTEGNRVTLMKPYPMPA